VNTLAIDIGGTKFTVALFVEGRLTQRESRATDREGGPGLEHPEDRPDERRAAVGVEDDDIVPPDAARTQAVG